MPTRVQGIRLLSLVIDLFKNVVEKIGDDDSDEDTNHNNQQKGPLLLEVYEANIHSIIRVNLQDQLQSCLFSTDLLHLVSQFLTLGICTDESVKVKTLEQLQSIFVANKTNKKQAELDYFALS
jgi:hypothetical protein